MTSIERTAYPRFKCAPTIKELREIYTPTAGDLAFVATTARGESQKFALMILLKSYQRLGYFPRPETIPGAVISHIRSVMKLPADLVPDIGSSHTLYRYYAQIREHLHIESSGKHLRHVATRAMATAAQVIEDPADLISAAIEVLVKEQCELPAFSTLDRIAGRVRKIVNERLYQTIVGRLSEVEQARLEQLLSEREDSSWTTVFNRIKEVPKSATLTHLEEWLSHLTWLQSLGNMEPLVQDLRSAKIAHLAAEARSLHATDVRELSREKRLTLLVCLIHVAQVSTRDEIVQMYIKRVRKLIARAKQELERLQEEERVISEHLIDVVKNTITLPKRAFMRQ